MLDTSSSSSSRVGMNIYGRWLPVLLLQECISPHVDRDGISGSPVIICLSLNMHGLGLHIRSLSFVQE